MISWLLTYKWRRRYIVERDDVSISSITMFGLSQNVFFLIHETIIFASSDLFNIGFVVAADIDNKIQQGRS
jgi:hypothetical protein